MANSREKIDKVADLVNQMSSASGFKVINISAAMRRQLGDLLVVITKNGTTLVLNGGSTVGVKNGEEMPIEEFQKKLQPGMRCIYNPKFTSDGYMDLGK